MARSVKDRICRCGDDSELRRPKNLLTYARMFRDVLSTCLIDEPDVEIGQIVFVHNCEWAGRFAMH